MYFLLNDTLTSVVEVRSERDVVDDMGVVELLHHLQVCLQGFNFWSQIFSKILYGLVAWELFKNPDDVTFEDVDAAKFLN